jgi:hypothetical protein
MTDANTCTNCGAESTECEVRRRLSGRRCCDARTHDRPVRPYHQW